MLIQHVHHIALILVGVCATTQAPRAITLFDTGVVTGGHRLETERVCTLEQCAELEVTVALDAWVRRNTGCVSLHVRVDHVLVEAVTEVEDVVVNAKLLRHPTGIVDIRHRAAPGIAAAAPQLHGDANYVVPLLEKQRSGNRRVDTAAHGKQHPHDAPRTVMPRSRMRCTAAGSTSSARSISASVEV